ncbi:MAG: maleylacetoacetate isomerase [Alphaproteobacteria bacterium]|nr:maleylacetoacetate isomerase [Alphaproteobacteria bacterium]
MKLYSYYRSSASYRLRIALALKGLPYDTEPINLLKREEHEATYRAINPQMLVPSLALDDGTVLTQSLSIMEYLEEVYPNPPLLPADSLGRARVRALALAVACEIHPLNVPRVLNHLVAEFSCTDEAKNRWMARWISEGFAAIETLLAHPATGAFCHGNMPTLADCLLIPQVFNALRFQVAMDPYPAIRRIYDHALAHPAFLAASPENQPDTPGKS